MKKEKGWIYKTKKPKQGSEDYIYDIEIQVETPDGRGMMVVIRNCKYDLEKDEFTEYGTNKTYKRKWFINKYKIQQQP